MADNTSIDPGTTPSVAVAADDIAGVKYQRVKIASGDDGTAVDVGPSNPLPVSGALTVSGTMPISVAVGQEVDGHSASIGATTDAAATTTGSVIAQLRRIANAIVAGLPASLGQKTMANSTGVTIASDQSAVPVSNASLPLPTGASTAAKQPALGTAGSASTDVLTVQGNASGTPIPISGSISVTGTMPTSSALASQVDGHSANIGLLADASSASTLTGLLKALKAALAGGTLASPNSTTLSVIQPDQTATGSVSSATTAASITTLNGASTVTTQVTSAGTATVTYETTVDGSTWTAINGVALNGTGAFVSTSTTTGIWQFDVSGCAGFRARVSAYTSGTITLFMRASATDAAFALDLPLPPGSNTIGALTANQSVSVASGQQVDGHSATLGSTSDAAATTTGSVIAQLRRVANLLAGTLTVSGTVTTTPPSNASSNVAQINGVTPLMGAGNTGTGSLRVTLATDQANLTTPLNTAPALPVQAATATLANVAGSASSVTLQALNTSRKGLIIVNDSTAILYVKFGSTASTTSYTYYLAGTVSGAPSILELPGVTYTGIVTGIWASAVGSARMTELT